MTDGVFDLYWIAVDPRIQRGGIGRALLARAEQQAGASGGRTMLIETSGQPRYEATRAFYVRAGYAEIARVPDYYRVGDDKLIYARGLRS
jgi:ribosomal protein S18 acetylase RimI-like enzyme